MSEPYPKINGLWKRDKQGRILDEWSQPEFVYLADLPWLWTEKVDGTNIRLTWTTEPAWAGNEHAYVQGRTDAAQIPPKLLNACVELMRRVPWADVFVDCDEVTLYGEGYGAGIQKGGAYRADPGFVLFDVKVGPWWLRRDDVVSVGHDLGIDVVPLVAECPIADALALVQDGFKSEWPDAIPEGLVGRPAVDLWDRKGQRITTKIKTKDFAS